MICLATPPPCPELVKNILGNAPAAVANRDMDAFAEPALFQSLDGDQTAAILILLVPVDGAAAFAGAHIGAVEEDIGCSRVEDLVVGNELGALKFVLGAGAALGRGAATGAGYGGGRLVAALVAGIAAHVDDLVLQDIRGESNQ